MAGPKVLDSFALIAFFEDESGAEEVERLLLKAEEAGQRLRNLAENKVLKIL